MLDAANLAAYIAAQSGLNPADDSGQKSYALTVTTAVDDQDYVVRITFGSGADTFDVTYTVNSGPGATTTSIASDIADAISNDTDNDGPGGVNAFVDASSAGPVVTVVGLVDGDIYSVAFLGATRAWTPIELGSKLFAWWDPSDSIVLSGSDITAITDKSTNGRDISAVGTGGTVGSINGLDAVQSANSATNYLEYSGSVAAVVEVFNAFDNSASDTIFIAGAGDSTSEYFGLVQASGLSPHNGAGSPSYYGNGDIISPVTRQGLYDAVQSGANVLATVSLDLSTWSAFRPFFYAGGGGLQYTGEFGDVVLLSSASTTEEQDRLEGYMAHKWGTEAKLDAGHPYKSAAPITADIEVASPTYASTVGDDLEQAVVPIVGDTLTIALSADVDDWDPTGLDQATLLVVTPDANPRTITGIVPYHRTLNIVNASTTNSLQLAHESGSSATANQFSLNGATSFNIQPRDAAVLVYDNVNSKWRLVR